MRSGLSGDHVLSGFFIFGRLIYQVVYSVFLFLLDNRQFDLTRLLGDVNRSSNLGFNVRL